MNEKELIILVGPIGVGKSTFSKGLKNDNSIRISQDEMGRKVYLNYFQEALDDKIPRIIIDRMGFNKEQRSRFIEPARAAGYCVTIFEFKASRELCFNRVVSRRDHPTVENNNPDLTNKILDMFYREYEPVSSEEFDNYNEVICE